MLEALSSLWPLAESPAPSQMLPKMYSFQNHANLEQWRENKNLIFCSLIYLIIPQLGLKLVTYLYSFISFIMTYYTVPPAPQQGAGCLINKTLLIINILWACLSLAVVRKGPTGFCEFSAPNGSIVLLCMRKERAGSVPCLHDGFRAQWQNGHLRQSWIYNLSADGLAEDST